MSIDMNAADARGAKAGATRQDNDFVTVVIAGQLFGIPVLQVRDVLGPQRITRVPLAPPEIAGSLNLRGRIVTAIDLRIRLGLPEAGDATGRMSVVVDHGGELYSLMVDSVGEVLSLSEASFERNPATLDLRWREIAAGIYRLDGKLLIVVDVGRLLEMSARSEAA
jgi:purine-binding chemotaxis protein CheW